MRKGMRKAASFSRWSLLLGVACGLAMLPVANRAARAEAIDVPKRERRPVNND